MTILKSKLKGMYINELDYAHLVTSLSINIGTKNGEEFNIMKDNYPRKYYYEDSDDRGIYDITINGTMKAQIKDLDSDLTNSYLRDILFMKSGYASYNETDDDLDKEIKLDDEAPDMVSDYKEYSTFINVRDNNTSSFKIGGDAGEDIYLKYQPRRRFSWSDKTQADDNNYIESLKICVESTDELDLTKFLYIRFDVNDSSEDTSRVSLVQLNDIDGNGTALSNGWNTITNFLDNSESEFEFPISSTDILHDVMNDDNYDSDYKSLYLKLYGVGANENINLKIETTQNGDNYFWGEILYYSEFSRNMIIKFEKDSDYDLVFYIDKMRVDNINIGTNGNDVMTIDFTITAKNFQVDIESS